MSVEFRSYYKIKAKLKKQTSKLIKIKKMGLFDFLKSKQHVTSISETGFFSISGEVITPIEELPKTGSYNDIAESLGFISFHGIITFDSKKISYIAFKRRTKEPIFVELRDSKQNLSYPDIMQIIKEINWEFEWRQLDFIDNIE